MFICDDAYVRRLRCTKGTPARDPFPGRNSDNGHPNLFIWNHCVGPGTTSVSRRPSPNWWPARCNCQSEQWRSGRG